MARPLDPLWIQDLNPHPEIPLSPANYAECFRWALRRIAIAVNWKTPKFSRYAGWLRSSDQKFSDRFTRRFKDMDRRSKFDASLFTFGYIDIDPGMADEAEATNYFYGQFKAEPSRGGGRTKGIMIEYLATKLFFQDSYKMLHRPKGDLDSLGYKKWGPLRFYETCATNYLVKNLWHNYAHVKLEGINFTNYHEFQGQARFESDFKADNLANFLLVHSYGVRVEAQEFQQERRDPEILAILGRNRCNKVFAIRDLKRGRRTASREEREWGYCRRLSNYVSGQLVAAGMAAATMGVYLTGNVVRDRRRNPEVVVVVNGFHIATGVRGLAEELAEMTSGEEREQARDENYEKVAVIVDSKYRWKLRSDGAFKRYAKNALRSTLQLVGVQ